MHSSIRTFFSVIFIISSLFITSITGVVYLALEQHQTTTQPQPTHATTQIHPNPKRQLTVNTLKTIITSLFILYLLMGILTWIIISQRLRKSTEQEKHFSANAAHELKNSIIGISIQAQLALKAQSHDASMTAIKKILQGVEQSHHLIEQLLMLSGILPHSNMHQPEKIDLCEHYKSTIETLTPLALKKQTTLRFTPPANPVYVLGYRPLLSVLLRNLVDNAIRYTPNKSLIQVTLEQMAPDQPARLTVIDNGPGIPDTLKEQVFEPFFRIADTQAKGSGLGMTIVKKIAALHQATLQLNTPQSGQGLEVTVCFPALKGYKKLK